ncbi:MAG: hypothetical protein NUV54_00285 [Candidatus Taylorbacteria bacterium]|nr:hypothetical protein [Candidatus Taylorbacteria bacterium]
MISTFKRVGETPFEALKRLREEQPDLKNAVLSYAGRLDPMAEGKMLVLVGDENNHRDKFMVFDKEYIATFLVGVGTDSYDALGLIEKEGEQNVSRARIEASFEKVRVLRKQTYPWFSGQTVDGIKLFEHYKNGNRTITRPTLPVEIKEATLVDVETVPVEEVSEYVKESIGKVHGDFRQDEILFRWKIYFEGNRGTMQTFTVRFRVSSGTYIRAFVEQCDFPALLLKLKRTKIFQDREGIL